MKKIISFSAICILASILFSSCKSNMFIAKRHYTNGYYIAHSESVKKTEENQALKEKTGRNNKRAVYSLQISPEVAKNAAHPSTSITEHNNLSASNEMIKGKPLAPKKLHGTIDKRKKISAYKISDRGTTVAELKKISSSSSDDGLSLFWIIILIILILWAVGFLAGGFGLGGLINLLLVIALVLLILWLLKIV